jgi:hypothetical protein
MYCTECSENGENNLLNQGILKKIVGIMMLLAIAGSVEAKNIHPVFGTTDQVIRSSSNIEIHIIDPIPVMSLDQVQGQNYIFDYHITRSITLKKSAGKNIVTSLLDSTQYLYGLNKKCPFMGKYAVRFQKGKISVTIILSTEPCDKAVIFCPGSPIDKKHIDLIEKSPIFGAIERALNPPIQVNSKK